MFRHSLHIIFFILVQFLFCSLYLCQYRLCLACCAYIDTCGRRHPAGRCRHLPGAHALAGRTHCFVMSHASFAHLKCHSPSSWAGVNCSRSCPLGIDRSQNGPAPLQARSISNMPERGSRDGPPHWGSPSLPPITYLFSPHFLC